MINMLLISLINFLMIIFNINYVLKYNMVFWVSRGIDRYCTENEKQRIFVNLKVEHSIRA